MRARLAELAGSPRQAAAAAAAGAADRAADADAATADHGASAAASAASAASGNGTSAAAASAGAAASAAAAAASAAAPLRVLQAELRRSGGFAIVDEEFGQDDVGEFFLSEGDYGKRLLRRCLLTVPQRRRTRCPPSPRTFPRPPTRQGRFRTFSLRSLLRARHGGSPIFSENHAATLR